MGTFFELGKDKAAVNGYLFKVGNDKAAVYGYLSRIREEQDSSKWVPFLN